MADCSRVGTSSRGGSVLSCPAWLQPCWPVAVGAGLLLAVLLSLLLVLLLLLTPLLLLLLLLVLGPASSTTLPCVGPAFVVLLAVWLADDTMNTVYEGCFTRGCVASFSAPQVPLYTKARHFVLARHLVVTAATSAHSRQGEPRGWPQSRSLPVTSLRGCSCSVPLPPPGAPCWLPASAFSWPANQTAAQWAAAHALTLRSAGCHAMPAWALYDL